jgi:FAD/FMN-containing dehydrogenase
VTANGQLLTVNAERYPDLFWAVRGGGGNFGVVTSFEYRLHPVGPLILGGMLLYPADAAADLLRFYRECMAAAPDELNMTVTIITAPPAPFVPQSLQGKPWFDLARLTRELLHRVSDNLPGLGFVSLSPRYVECLLTERFLRCRQSPLAGLLYHRS